MSEERLSIMSEVFGPEAVGNYGSIQVSNGGSQNFDLDDDSSYYDELASLIDNIDNKDAPLKESPESRERSLWSRLVFGWFVPVLKRANSKKKLDQEDLFLVPLPNDCSTNTVGMNFDRYWQEEIDTKENPSLVRAFYRAFGYEFMIAGFLKLISDVSTFVGPLVLNAMIKFLRDPDAPIWHGWALTIAVTLSQIIMSLTARHYYFLCYKTGLRIRTAVVMSIYRKALVLSASERQTRSLGEISNLTSIDAQRLQDITSFLHSLWDSPVQIALAIFLLWQQLGASSFAGVAVIIIMIPLTNYVAKWMSFMQKKLMRAKDQRVELNGEVLAGMKNIKLQAWEESFQERIIALRNVELKNLCQYFVGSASSGSLFASSPNFVAVATFAAYVWSGHVVDVASALTALSIFAILKMPLFLLPQIMNNAMEASVSLARIRSFLLSEEYRPVGSNGLEEVGVRMENVSAAYDSKKPKVQNENASRASRGLVDKDWEVALLRSQLQDAERHIQRLTGRQYSSVDEDSSTSLLCLKRVDFECKAGEMVAVVGGVGSGKSSFLNAILGEVRELAGKTSVNGKISYFSQSPFILNASVRDNILFSHVNEPADEELYLRAIECCALTHDLNILSDGDATEIGEKGVTLSGGQKARVALARAVYHCGDVTVIDDALSAVDAHVGEHIFEEAIVGELMKPKIVGGVTKQRSVVFVTNALQYLNHPQVTKVAVLNQGSVVEQGSYADLAGREDSVFSRFLAAIEESGINSDSLERPDVQEGGPDQERRRSSRSSRRSSRRSTLTKEEMQKEAAKLMSEESRKTGHVSNSVYRYWIEAAGGYIVPVVFIAAFGLGEGFSVLTNWFLTFWSENGTEENQNRYLAFYALTNLGAYLMSWFRAILVFLTGLKASKKLFERMLSVVMHAPQSFFDTTPIGRLINRFSKDINTCDEMLMQTLRTYLSQMATVTSTIIVICAVTPFFGVVLVPTLMYYTWQQSVFTVSNRELKRLDSSSRSPIFALLGESVDGVAVIRSFNAEGTLIRRLTAMMDHQQHAYFLTFTAQCWLSVRLELVGTLIITFTALTCCFERLLIGADETFAGLAGLALSYALNVTGALSWSVRLASDMEANMVAIERVQEYTTIESEGERRTPGDDKLPAGWPVRGEVEFRGAKLRYRPGLPLVLKGLDITFPSGSKVGVVGRTGAGKSTLVASLLRIVELCGGKILIDGHDIRNVGLAKLRNSIAVIPQDPVLYSGTVRTNLDPFGRYSDDRLCETLERVGLYNSCNELGYSGHSSASAGNARVESLDDPVSEGGDNFSVGQRQLLVIARALLQGSMIVIMDEATAAVDVETDATIQKVMRQDFKDATVITVAHRLNTIMDSDYILVMSDGKASEFDTPQKLLDKGGLFRDLVVAAARDLN